LFYLRQLLPILLYAAAFYYTGLFRRDNLFIFAIVGFLALTFISSIFSGRRIVKKQAEKLTDDPANASFFTPSFLQFSDTGVVTRNNNSSSHFQWHAFNRLLENEQYYFLFTNAVQAVIVPKRCIAPVDKSNLDKMLRQHISFDAEIGHLVQS
jgi:hypothetical protein